MHSYYRHNEIEDFSEAGADYSAPRMSPIVELSKILLIIGIVIIAGFIIVALGAHYSHA